MSGPCGARIHGTASAYKNHGCRCPLALKRRELQKLHPRESPGSRIPVVGTRRRLQALRAMGWDNRRIATELGWADYRLLNQILYKSVFVTRTMHARIAELYDRLSMTPGPSRRAVLNAQRKGWAPPLAWDDDRIDDPAAEPVGVGFLPVHRKRGKLDENVIRRALDGQRVRLSRAERYEAARRMHQRGVPHKHICEQLHMSGASLRAALEREDGAA